MRRVGWRALLAGVMTIGLASTAWAGFGNRDDLVDVDNFMVADSVDSPLASNNAFLELQGDTVFGSGSVNNGGASSTFTGIQWFAFEPDQMKRSSSSGAAQQRNELGMVVTLNGSTLFAGIVPGCKAKVQVKAPKGSLVPSDVNKGNWSVNCSKKSNDTMMLTDQQLTDLQTALGKKVVGKSSLNIKGKCTDANCNIVF